MKHVLLSSAIFHLVFLQILLLTDNRSDICNTVLNSLQSLLQSLEIEYTALLLPGLRFFLTFHIPE